VSGFARAFGGQLRHPRGLLGRLLAIGMARANRIVVTRTIAEAGITPDSDVLDLGCGGGEGLARLCRAAPDGRVHGLDHAPLMVARARRTNPDAHVVQGTFDALPYPDASFDRIVAINVAYFWDDPARVRAELLRVIRPGGRIVVYITSPRHLERIGLSTSGTHRLWSAEQIVELFNRKARVLDIRAGPGADGQIIVYDVAERGTLISEY